MSESKQSESRPDPSLPNHLPVQKELQKTLEQVIQEKAPEVLKSIPDNERHILAQVKIEEHRISMRSSPLPDPGELAAYNQIIPNGADRIMKMTENQSAHRISIEKLVVSSQQRQSFFGQLFGLIIGISGLGFATYAAVCGQPWFGSVIGGATLVSLVSAFLVSRQDQKRELTQKREQTQMQNQKTATTKNPKNRQR